MAFWIYKIALFLVFIGARCLAEENQTEATTAKTGVTTEFSLPVKNREYLKPNYTLETEEHVFAINETHGYKLPLDVKMFKYNKTLYMEYANGTIIDAKSHEGDSAIALQFCFAFAFTSLGIPCYVWTTIYSHSCFSARSTVSTLDGRRIMRDINVGDRVLTIDRNGNVVFRNVYMWLDRVTRKKANFVHVTTASNHSIQLTSNHMLPVVDQTRSYSKVGFDSKDVLFAKDVQQSDTLYIIDRTTGRIAHEKVVDIGSHVDEGVYAPLTENGNILVDGIAASCFANGGPDEEVGPLNEDLMNWVFAPMRLVSTLVTCNDVIGFSEGWHWYSLLLSKFHQSIIIGSKMVI